ncbi:hypothetical protein HY639_04025 [Candidatus Woesearchaeota archaeon]|nr:hypothetical protein [Candidatus Woesearchaeota archaeon]
MKRLLLALSLASAAYGEIRFECMEKPLQEKVVNAAQRFSTRRYADLGSYNFHAAKEKYVARMDKTEYIGYYNPHENVICIDDSVTEPSVLEFIAFHEFSHAYDYRIGDCLGELGKRITDCTESRAQSKELLYLDEMKKTLSGEEYQKLEQGYAVVQEARRMRAVLQRYQPFFPTGNLFEQFAPMWRTAFAQLNRGH